MKEAIAERLLLTRLALKIKQQNTFAVQAGLKPSAYHHYESGLYRPSIEAAFALCDTYGLTLDWIYNGDPGGMRSDLVDAIRALRMTS